MFSNGFPKEWSTLRKLAWLYRTVINAVSAVLKTIIGNPIHITDALAKPAQALSIALEPIQDLHGYDSPWPAGGGKNLLDPAKRTETSQNIYYYLADGVLLKAGTYTLSVSGENAAGIYVQKKADSSNITVKYNNTTATFTVSEDVVAYINIYYSPAPSDISSIKCQLELGSTATAWTPYSNSCPISGFSAVGIEQTGKNLCEPIEAGYKNESGFWFNGTDIASVKKTLNTLPVGEYTISFKFDVLTTVSGATSWGILIHNTVSGYIDGRQNGQHNAGETLSFSKTFSVTESNKGKFDHVYMYSGGGIHADVYWYDFQLELGSTATAYEPYVGTTYPIPLGQTVYGGTLDVKAGKMTVDRVITTALNSLSWEYRTGEYAYSYFASSLNDKKAGSIKMLCSQYKTATGGRNTLTSDGMIAPYNISNSKGICIRDDAYSDAATFAASLSGVQLVYELATPTTIQLTPQQVELLQGENNIWSDGEMTLVYLADGNASDVEALNILLGGRYVNNHGEDEPTDREALDILLGR